jgi:hypothetical protein
MSLVYLQPIYIVRAPLAKGQRVRFLLLFKLFYSVRRLPCNRNE